MTRSRIVVVSPHLDDAVLSVGALIAAAARRGDEVCVLTVFAGDPGSASAASEWDARAGFTTEGEAARARRREDAAACALLGAGARWLEGMRALSPPELRARLRAEVAGAELVLVPGFPCAHGDHLLVCNVFIEDAPPGLAFYVEQPYATWRLAGTRHPAPVRLRRLAAAATGRPSLRDEQQPVLPDSLAAAVEASVAWEAAPASAVDRRLKRRAIRAYRSQVAIFGTPLLGAIALYERAWGGEGIGRLAPAEGTPPLLPAFGKKA